MRQEIYGAQIQHEHHIRCFCASFQIGWAVPTTRPVGPTQAASLAWDFGGPAWVRFNFVRLPLNRLTGSPVRAEIASQTADLPMVEDQKALTDELETAGMAVTFRSVIDRDLKEHFSVRPKGLRKRLGKSQEEIRAGLQS
jgi:hypothetical protein